MIKETLFDHYTVSCEVIAMGKDYTIAVYGGDTPHIGSAVLAVARPSLTGSGTGVTASVINCTGHKDEEIARLFAETVAREKNGTVVCTCGIHIDHLLPKQIKVIEEKCQMILTRLLKELE